MLNTIMKILGIGVGASFVVPVIEGIITAIRIKAAHDAERYSKMLEEDVPDYTKEMFAKKCEGCVKKYTKVTNILNNNFFSFWKKETVVKTRKIVFNMYWIMLCGKHPVFLILTLGLYIYIAFGRKKKYAYC